MSACDIRALTRRTHSPMISVIEKMAREIAETTGDVVLHLKEDKLKTIHEFKPYIEGSKSMDGLEEALILEGYHVIVFSEKCVKFDWVYDRQ